jgi:hypothetical protein
MHGKITKFKQASHVYAYQCDTSNFLFLFGRAVLEWKQQVPHHKFRATKHFSPKVLLVLKK